MKAPKEAKAVDNIATAEYFPEAPRLYVSDAKNATSTGYIQGKGYSLDYNDQLLGKDQTAFVVYRASEAYLNYIEASYLKNGNIDATADKYWKALRARAHWLMLRCIIFAVNAVANLSERDSVTWT